MVEISNLVVTVGYNDDAVRTGVAGTSQHVEGLGSKIQSALGAAALGAVAGLGVAFVGSIKSAADFEKGISAISAVSGATKEDLEGIRQTALQLGKDTSFSAAEATSGMEEMVKAGVSLQDVMNGAGRAALDLAAAGGVAVPEAAALMSNAINIFRKDNLSAAESADIISQAANASAISVHDFGFSLSSSGAVAATLGFTLQDTATAIAVLGQAGLKGSDAGTSLKTMMMGLIPTTAKQKEIFSDLGLTTYNLETGLAGLRRMGLEPTEESFKGVYEAMYKHLGIGSDATKWTKEQSKAFGDLQLKTGLLSSKFFDASGSAKNWAEIAGVLQDALKGMTKEQQIATLETMFGSDAIRAAAIMADAGTEGINKMAEAEKNAGTARSVAAERLNNLSGSFEAFMGSVETGGIILGSLFTPMLKSMVDDLTKGVNQGIGIIEQIPDAIETVKQVLAGDWSSDASIHPFTNAVGEAAIVFRDQLLPSIMRVADFITGTLVPAFVDVGTFLADHAEIIAGIAVAWASFTIISTVAGWVMSAVAAWGAMSGAIATAGGVIAAIVAVLGGPLTIAIVAIAAIVGVLTAAWIGNWGDIQGKTAAVAAWLQTNIPIMITTIKEIAAAVAEAAVAFVAWASKTATTVATWVTNTIAAITTWVADTLVMFIAWGVAAQLAVDTTWLAIETAVTLAWTTITAAFAAGILAITTAWQAGWNALGAIVTAAWNLITPENQVRIAELLVLFGQLWTLAGKLWTVGTAALLTLVTDWWTAIVKLWTTTTAAITTIITDWWTAISGLWTTQTAAVMTTTTTWWTATSAAWTAGTTAVMAVITPWWVAITALWTTTTAAILATAAIWWAAIAAAWTAGTAAVMAVLVPWWAAVTTTWTAAQTAIVTSVGAFFTLVGNAWTTAKTTLGTLAAELGAAIMAALVGALNSAAQSVIDAVIGTVRKAIEGARGLITGFGASVPTGGGMQTLSYNGSNQEKIARAGQVALRSGLDQEGAAALQAVLRTEGGLQGGVGDGGKSHGPYQLFEGGQFPAFAAWLQQQGIQGDPKQLANDIDISTRYAAGGYLGSAIRQGQAQGLSGPALATYAQQHGQVSIDPWKAGQNWQPFTGGPAATNPADMQRIPLGQGTGAPGGDPSQWPGFMSQVNEQLPDYLTSLETIQQSGTLAFTGTAQAAATQGAAMVSTSTDALGNVTRIYAENGLAIGATITNTAGQIVNSWGTMATGVTGQSAVMATGVVANTNLMTSGALTSVTALGTGILTTVQTSAGTTIATVTDMQGQVTSQYATLANGAQLSMDGLSAGVLVSTTDLGTGMMTIVQDAAGNYIATITDLAGNVTSQYTQLGTDVVQQAVDMNTGVTAEAATMAEGSIESTQTMRDSVTENVATMNADASAEALAMAEYLIGQAQVTQDEATAAAQAMQEDVVSAVSDMAVETGRHFDSIKEPAQNATTAMEAVGEVEIGEPDVSGVINAMKKVEKAANKASSAVATVGGKGGKKSGGGHDDDFGKAVGGPVDFGQMYLVGEQGPELFAPWSNGTIIPNNRLGGGGGGGGGGDVQYHVIDFKIGGDLAERIVVLGRDILIKRGTISAGSF